MSVLDPQPSWLAGPCPTWCVQEHGETDHPDDRRHQTHATHLPVVRRVVAAGASSLATVEDWVVVGHAGVDEKRIWVYAGQGEGSVGVDLTRESAGALSAALLTCLADLDC